MYFEVSGRVYYNNSIVTMLETGEGNSALLCKTNLGACCQSARLQFSNRGDSVIRLHRREKATILLLVFAVVGFLMKYE